MLANSLRERRHFLNVTKFSHETATIKNLHRNEAWLRQKLQKNALHSRLWTVRDQTATLQVQTPAARRLCVSGIFTLLFNAVKTFVDTKRILPYLTFSQQNSFPCESGSHLSTQFQTHMELMVFATCEPTWAGTLSCWFTSPTPWMTRCIKWVWL